MKTKKLLVKQMVHTGGIVSVRVYEIHTKAFGLWKEEVLVGEAHDTRGQNALLSAFKGLILSD